MQTLHDMVMVVGGMERGVLAGQNWFNFTTKASQSCKQCYQVGGKCEAPLDDFTLAHQKNEKEKQGVFRKKPYLSLPVLKIC